MIWQNLMKIKKNFIIAKISQDIDAKEIRSRSRKQETADYNDH